MKIEKVGVIGGGIMGSGIVEMVARANCPVLLHEPSPELCELAGLRIERSLHRAVERDKLSDTERQKAWDLIDFSHQLGDMSDRDLVIEAVPEQESLKREIFVRLDDLLRSEEAIMVSNTSSIPITRLAAATRRPSKVVGLHFFNPAPVMGLVEMVTTVLSSPTTEALVEEFAHHTLGKTVIRVKDRAGFVVNRLLVPYMLSAIRMLDSGIANASDIDTAMRMGANHPMGPLKLCDLVGLDTMQGVAEVLFAEHKEPSYAPPPLLTRMVEAGMLGKKSGQGFYSYQS